MTRFILVSFLLLALALLATPRAVQAAESYDNCTGFITSIPTVISTQGTWCLKQDLATAITSGDAITINTNNVTIDCNNFKLGGLAAGLGTTAIGIHAVARINATVRHCNIRGFLGGIYFSGITGGGHAIEDNRFDGNTYVAAQIEGDGSVIRRNRAFDTGGSTVVTEAYGFYTQYSVDLIDNTVSTVLAQAASNANAYGIYTQQNSTGRIVGNGVNGVLGDGAGLSGAIYSNNSDRITLAENHVVGNATGATFGLRCTNNLGRAKDNVIGGFATAIGNCGDAGGNDITP